jgi:hypothetical protein
LLNSVAHAPTMARRGDFFSASVVRISCVMVQMSTSPESGSAIRQRSYCTRWMNCIACSLFFASAT